jgi:hypothetical protein
MSNIKNNLKNIKNFNNVKLDGFTDKVSENFGKALEILIPNWVSNGVFGLGLFDTPNTTDKIVFSAYTINPFRDAKPDFQNYITNDINTSDVIKKLGQFEINMIANELGFKSIATKTEVNWNNYPCVTSVTDKKEIKGSDGSITYEISGFTYFGNGTMKDKAGSSFNYSCSTDKKTIVTGSTSPFISGSGSSGTGTSGGGEGFQTGLNAIEKQLIAQGAGGQVTRQIPNQQPIAENLKSTKEEILVEQLIRMKKLMNL